MEQLSALRILSGKRRGSSRPILAETSHGPKIVKLRGAAQGTGPLVAEIIVAELAVQLGLRVPARCLVRLDPGVEVIDGDDELADVLAASIGNNLGFDYLDDAIDMNAGAAGARVSADDQAALLWLDRFVLNPDRTAPNPNLLWAREQIWLIDHGAALGFQYDWRSVTEDTPRRPTIETEPHLFARSVSRERLAESDKVCAERITRDVLQVAVDAVPATFLTPMFAVAESEEASHETLRRRRAAYVAFLWKRLKTPRPFLASTVVPPGNRGTPPAWVGAR